MPVGWPLIGRGTDLDRLRDARRRQGCAVAVVVGPAGVGKTRLAEEFLAEAAAKGIPTGRAAAVRETARVPFGAFLHLLTDAEPTDAGVRAEHSLDLLRHAAAAFGAQARGRRAVLLVDDIPLLDESSAALVHHLAVTGAAFVVATARETEHLPDLVTALWRQGRVEEVELAPLDRDQVAGLLRQVLGGPVDSGAAHRLWRLSSGNPLFLRELVRAALQQDVLSEHDGLWSLSRPPTVPGALERLLEHRFADLPGPVRQVVELVAYAEPMRLDVLEGLVQAEALEESEQAGLIRVVRDRHRIDVVCEHPLYGEVVRQATPALRARRLTARLARALVETGPGRREDRLRLALWQVEGLLDADPATLLSGAREAMTFFDHALTARLADAAAANGAGFEAELLAAEARVWLGQSDHAERLLGRLSEQPRTEYERFRVAQARATNLFFRMGRTDDARRVIGEALAAVGSEPARSLLRLLEAGIVLRQGRPGPAIELVPDPPDEAARPHTLPILISAYSWMGRTRQAIELGEAGQVELAGSADRFPYLPNMARLALVGGYLLHGELRAAEELAAAGYDQALEWGSDQLRANWAMTQGVVALHAGRLRRAAEDLREGAALLPRFTTLMGQTGIAYCLSELALAQLWLGDAVAAQGSLAAAGALPIGDCFVPSYRLAHAWLRSARGQPTEAVADLDAVHDAAIEYGSRSHAARALHDTARLGAAQHVVRRLNRVAAEADGPLVRAYADHAKALADKNGAALMAVAEQFARLGLRLLAAEAFAEAAAVLPEQAAHHAREASRRYRELCDWAQTPALQLVDAVPGLSPRQRQIAQLAASGMANQAIADSLRLSVRTVESHLSSAYVKLGVRSRAELADALQIRDTQVRPT